MDKEPIVITMENPRGKRVPKWARSAILNTDGEIYVPALMGGNELQISASAAWDGVAMMALARHPFVPLTWLAREKPVDEELWQKVRQKVTTAADTKGMED